MDSSITFLARVCISFSVAQHDVTHNPAYQPEFLSSRTISINSRAYSDKIGNPWADWVGLYFYIKIFSCSAVLKSDKDVRLFRTYYIVQTVNMRDLRRFEEHWFRKSSLCHATVRLFGKCCCLLPNNRPLYTAINFTFLNRIHEERA
jgi:hypothetical protein